VSLLERLGLRRGGSVALTLALGIGLLVLMGLSIVPMVVTQVSNLASALPGFLEQVRQSEWLRSLDTRFGVKASVESQLPQLPTTIAGPVLGVLSSSLGLLITGITVLTISVFSLLSGRALFDQALLWVRPDQRPELRELLLDMKHAITGYLAGALIVCFLGGMSTAIVTWALGVPYFLALGLMYLVLGFVPYLGSLVVAITVSVTTLATVGFRRMLIALALFLLYQQIESHVVQPLVQRRTLRMNALLVVIVLVGGVMVMGVLGAILALPIAAALQVLLQRVRERRVRQWEREGHAPPPIPLPPAPPETQEPLHH
jgi:predicted PurR-regulated permease PerM